MQLRRKSRNSIKHFGNRRNRALRQQLARALEEKGTSGSPVTNIATNEINAETIDSQQDSQNPPPPPPPTPVPQYSSISSPESSLPSFSPPSSPVPVITLDSPPPSPLESSDFRQEWLDFDEALEDFTKYLSDLERASHDFEEQ